MQNLRIIELDAYGAHGDVRYTPSKLFRMHIE